MHGTSLVHLTPCDQYDDIKGGEGGQHWDPQPQHTPMHQGLPSLAVGYPNILALLLWWIDFR